jgi:hypothetical protein
MSSCNQFWTIVFGIAVVLFIIVGGGAGDMVRSLLEHREKTEAEIGRDKS